MSKSSIEKNFNSQDYKFKSSEFLISVSNFKLNNNDLTYEEDDDFAEFDNEDENKEKNEEQKNKLPDLYSNDIIADNFVNINKQVKDINLSHRRTDVIFIQKIKRDK